MTGKISIAILCGGKSLRMGSDKASLTWKGVPLAKYKWQQFSEDIEDITERKKETPFTSRIGEVFFSVRDEEQGQQIREMLTASCIIPETIPDEFPGCGPLGGIGAALKHCSTEFLFVTAVDMPFTDPVIVEELAKSVKTAANTATADAVVPVTADGRYHPLCALYKKSCLPAIEEQLREGNYKVINALKNLHVKYVQAQDLTDGEKKLANINDRKQYHAMSGASVPVYSLIAWSDTGKTTYLEKLIPALKKRGVRVAVIKHDGHDFDIDRSGTDSAKFTRAGADISGIFSDSHAALMLNGHVEAEALVSLVAASGMADLILTEGCKKGKWPKILLYRAGSGKPMAADPDRCAAVVSDVRVDTNAPVFPIQDADALAAFLEEKVSAFSHRQKD